MMTQREALLEAARQFRQYEDSHRVQAGMYKIEPERDTREAKAETNRRMAEMCESVANSRPYQVRVDVWHRECFGFESSADPTERADRHLEEVLELLQGLGYDFSRIAMLADYVASRPAGRPAQEVGGVMLTLAALCNAHNIDLGGAAEAELGRVNDPATLLKIRAKQVAKPRGGPLPS